MRERERKNNEEYAIRPDPNMRAALDPAAPISENAGQHSALIRDRTDRIRQALNFQSNYARLN